MELLTMAQPELLKDGYVTILLGDAATPTEAFTAICGLTTRSFTEGVNTADRFIRDCTNPEDVPIRRITVTGVQWSLSGSGLLARESIAAVRAAFGITRNWRFAIGKPSGATGWDGYFMGPAVLTAINYGATEGEFVNLELTIASDGEWEWTELT
jgi:predicted secreted protein